MAVLPALSILIALVILAIVVLWKLSADQVQKVLLGQGLPVIVAVSLFGLLLVAHLFSAQPWTADVLKVLVGFLAGASSTKLGVPAKAAGKGSGVEAAGAMFGDNARIAGRDINETIEKMFSDMATIKNAVVHASTTSAPRGTRDFLINSIYQRDQTQIPVAVERVVNAWQGQGWEFEHLTSDYQGMDGLFLIFSRPSDRGMSQVRFFHGTEMSPMVAKPS